jgi:hypothetical protein
MPTNTTREKVRFHSIATALKDINSPFAAASKDEEEEEYDSAADEDFFADKEDEESLGDVDTDIEEEEVNNLEADINMPATASKKSMTPKKAAKTDDVSALSGQMGKLNISKQVKYVSLDWRFPMCMYSIMEGNCNMIYIELMKGVQLPPEYIVHAKVLPGGMQFSLLVGVPCYFFEESYMQAHMVETTAPDLLFFRLLTAPSSSQSASSSPEPLVPLKELHRSSTLTRSVLRALFLTTLAMPVPKELSGLRRLNSTRVP